MIFGLVELIFFRNFSEIHLFFHRKNLIEIDLMKMTILISKNEKVKLKYFKFLTKMKAETCQLKMKYPSFDLFIS